ncbi:cell envelope biogenesis protein TolA [Ancylobacter mangrovi]|uniref:cell envelope biogenesis protein TolA n=1 Tax=Ancylobacter mangrovi TaxID=2972472 RepID=UPI0021618511|nr:cell envelope biogenesis protein TolA [Ancylobacter mangrovi]MCS0503914.1 cell envelope biogenesis protein TolA [Ancylobacter mangrovi]
MRVGIVSSTALHLGIIGFMVISFASPSPFEVPPSEAMPIDIISDAEMSQMMAGKKDAPRKEDPKPVVEKVEDKPKPAENLEAKVEDKPEIKASREAAAPPPPPQEQAKPAEQKPPAEKAEAKPEPAPPKDAESLAAKPPEPKQEQQPKPEETAQAAPAPVPPSKPKNIPPKVVQAPPKDQKEFNPNDIAALLNKQDARRMASIGDTINNTSSLGASTGYAPTLSLTELDALRAYLARFWHMPTGAADVGRVKVMVVLRLSPNRTLIGRPEVVGMENASNPYAPQMRESVLRAIYAAAQQPNPFPMLSAEKYDVWREMQLTFDPSWIN